MLPHLLLLFVLVATCVAIHGIGTTIGLRWLSGAWPRRGHRNLFRNFWIINRVVFGLLLLHLLQITVWAAVYDLSGCLPDFDSSFYYSATSYSTVGFGDVVPTTNWRIFGAIEAVTGVLMFGWSTGILFSVVTQLGRDFSQVSAQSPPDAER